MLSSNAGKVSQIDVVSGATTTHEVILGCVHTILNETDQKWIKWINKKINKCSCFEILNNLLTHKQRA